MMIKKMLLMVFSHPFVLWIDVYDDDDGILTSICFVSWAPFGGRSPSFCCCKAESKRSWKNLRGISIMTVIMIIIVMLMIVTGTVVMTLIWYNDGFVKGMMVMMMIEVIAMHWYFDDYDGFAMVILWSRPDLRWYWTVWCWLQLSYTRCWTHCWTAGQKPAIKFENKLAQRS